MEGRQKQKTAFQYLEHFVEVIFEIKYLRNIDGKLVDLNKYTIAGIKTSN